MDRRARIFSAGQEVFARKGYERTTISDIVKTAGVAQGTFYLYYGGKKDLFVKIIQDFFVQFLQVLEQHSRRQTTIDGDNARWLNENFYYGILNVFYSQKEMALIFLREAVRIDPEFEAMRSDFVDQCKQMIGVMLEGSEGAGVTRCVNANIMAYAMIGMVEKVAYEMLIKVEDTIDLRKIAKELSLFTQYGLFLEKDFDRQPLNI